MNRQVWITVGITIGILAVACGLFFGGYGLAGGKYREEVAKLEGKITELEKRPTQQQLDVLQAKITELEKRPTQEAYNALVTELGKRPTQQDLERAREESYREGWDACYRHYWQPYPPHPPSPPYPPYPQLYPPYPAKFVAVVYRGENFEGGCVGTFEDPYPINHNWGYGGPLGLTDYFSIRWEGGAWFETGSYRFRVCADDGVRLYIDGYLVIDKWFPQVATTYEANWYLSQGPHNIRLEYFERTGHAVISLFWERI